MRASKARRSDERQIRCCRILGVTGNMNDLNRYYLDTYVVSVLLREYPQSIAHSFHPSQLPFTLKSMRSLNIFYPQVIHTHPPCSRRADVSLESRAGVSKQKVPESGQINLLLISPYA